MAKKDFEKIITPVFRVSFPQVFQPKAAPGSEKEKYSLVMIFKKGEDLSVLKDLIKKVVKEAYPDGIPEGFHTPLKDGNEKEYDGYKDTIYCTASSMQQPGVLDETKQPIINPIEFYAGCYAIATVNVYTWKYMGKQGVSIGLQNLMKIDDGEPLTGGASAEADFSEIVVPEEEVADKGDELSILG
jgi:hypothetical protein